MMTLFLAARAGVAAKGKPSEQQQLGQVLAVLVRGVTLLGLLATCCGPWYAYVLLRLVYGRQWADTEAPLVLSCYTGYILLLAVNGETGSVGGFVNGW
jgi:oligosaccharide translocation protein RFT1